MDINIYVKEWVKGKAIEMIFRTNDYLEFRPEDVKEIMDNLIDHYNRENYEEKSIIFNLIHDVKETIKNYEWQNIKSFVIRVWYSENFSVEYKVPEDELQPLNPFGEMEMEEDQI